MAQKFLTNLNLNQNQLINATFEVLTTNPSSGNFEGRMYFNSVTFTIMVYANGGWKKTVHSITSGGGASEAITVSESNGTITITPNLATASDDGVMSASDKAKLDASTSEATASTLIIRDVNGKAKVATPTDSAHIATKGYVDSARQGLDVKASVRAATTGPINLATDLQAGDAIDGVTLSAGDRVLVKDQTSASENGIYVAVASGAASRSSDTNGTADTGELTSGTFTFVEGGTVNFDSGFVVSTDGTITVGSTGITWTQFSGAGSFDAGAGLSKSGTQVNVNVTANRTAITSDAIDISANYVGQSSITTLGTITTGEWGAAATDIAVASGGTGASDATTARTNLGIKTTAGTVSTGTPGLARIAAQASAASIGTTSVTTVSHYFNTTDVIVQVYEVATGETVYGDVLRSNADTVTVTLQGSNYSANAFRIVVTAINT